MSTVDNTLTLDKDGNRILAFRVVLSAAEEGAIMRAANCNQYNVANAVRHAIEGAIDTLAARGFKGIEADYMIGTGQIEVGKPAQL